MKTKTILIILGSVVVVGGGIAAVWYYNKKKRESVSVAPPNMEGEGVNIKNALDMFKNVLGLVQSISSQMNQQQTLRVTQALNNPQLDEYKRAELKNELKKKGYVVRYVEPILNGVVAPTMGVNAGWIVQKG